MADRSVGGWDIFEKYEVDPVASETDDNKKVRQA